MTTRNRPAILIEEGPIFGLALLFFTLCTWASFARWANFEYRTFDLAFYVQGLWQFLKGRYYVSVAGVPLLGNHVEPIVFLIAPLFFLIPHPLLLVFLQNAALALMGPVAFKIGRELGLERRDALLLASAILLTPATSYIALHEFHPEAFAALFFLLVLHARLRRSLNAHWGWLLALLACKENLALLIIAYCGVQTVLEWKRPILGLLKWYIGPMGLAIFWLFVCTKLITPALNSGAIDYLALYDRLGTSASDILVNAITQPARIFGALSHSLAQGNLVWGLLLPFLAVPLIRPRWLLISTPILLQHLLSWRPSEWTIYFHYAAPLLPLFWIALAEGVMRINQWAFAPVPIRRAVPFLVVAACVTAQIGPVLGANRWITHSPTFEIAAATAKWFRDKKERSQKKAFISQITPDASVLAPLPYLSHLATREKLFSLHYVLKGLKTLSRVPYQPPPPTDFVLIDYADSATFDQGAGYYHPMMKTADGRLIPSSDQLLHEFLARTHWIARCSNELTILQQTNSPPELASTSPSQGEIAVIGTGTTLVSLTKVTSGGAQRGLEISTTWNFQGPRDVFPWMFLKFTTHDRHEVVIPRGLCAPEAVNGLYTERWHVTLSDQVPAGDYDVEVFFTNNSKRLWGTQSSAAELGDQLLAPPVSFGKVHVTAYRIDESLN